MRIPWPIVAVCLMVLGWRDCAGAQQVPQPGPQTANDRWTASASVLAKQIAGLTGPGPATLTVQNSSSIAADQVTPIRRTLEAALRASGISVRVASESAAVPTAIRVTLSQTSQKGLWVAEVQQGTETRVAMTEVALETSAVVQPASTITLRKQLLFSGAEPVLDAQTFSVNGESNLMVLTAVRISVFRQNAGQWVTGQSFAVEHANSFPRDVRGELALNGNGVSAYLPGVVCDGTSSAGQWSFSCRASDDPWPIGTQKAFYSAPRNYFSGVLSPAYGGDLPPFYSAAELVRPGGVATVFSDVHGHVRLLERGTQTEVTGSRDWGSDIASVRSGCGSGMQVLVDAAGDPLVDSLRAYELNGREAAAVSSILPLDGMVTALHASSDGTVGIAMVHAANQTTNPYEVWRVSLDCH